MVRATLGKKVKITSKAIGRNEKSLSHFEEPKVVLSDAKGVHFDECDGRDVNSGRDPWLESSPRLEPRLEPPRTSLIALGLEGKPGEPGVPGVPGVPGSEPPSRDLRSLSATPFRILPIRVTIPNMTGSANMITYGVSATIVSRDLKDPARQV
eukprot:scaffold75374_cov69-Phaeocystis_antarctica.AAC.9